MLELGVAIGVILAFLGLTVGLQTIAPVGEQGGDGLVAHGMALAAQLLGERPRALAGPEQGRLRVPARGRLDQVAQGTEEGRVVLLDEMPRSSWGRSARRRNSLRPAQMVVRDRPVAWATRWTPPRPKDSASQAAHCRRIRSVMSGSSNRNFIRTASRMVVSFI